MISPIIGLHFGRHLGYIEMLNDARVASLGFFKNSVCTTRINKEKKIKLKFQVPLKFALILPDYVELFCKSDNIRNPIHSQLFLATKKVREHVCDKNNNLILRRSLNMASPRYIHIYSYTCI